MYEAGPRHVDLLPGSMGLTKANGVGTPGTMNPVADYDATKSNASEALQIPDSLEPSHGDNLEPSLADKRILDSLHAISHNIHGRLDFHPMSVSLAYLKVLNVLVSMECILDLLLQHQKDVCHQILA